MTRTICPHRKINNKYLTCTLCNSIYCYECLNICNNSAVGLSRTQLATLECPSCANVTRRMFNDDNMPVGVAPEKRMEHGAQSLAFGNIQITQAAAQYVNQTPEPLTLDSFSKLLDDKLSISSPFAVSMRDALKEDIKELVVAEVNATVNGLVAEFTTTTDFLNMDQANIKNKIAERDRKIDELEHENTRVQTEMMNMNKRLCAIENISRDHNIEIQGLPENQTENLLEIFKTICDTISFPILDSDIHGFRRVAKIDPSTSRPRNIIIVLSSPRLRDQILNAVRLYNNNQAKNKHGSRHLGLTVGSQKVNVVEHIAPETKQIHAATKRFARENNYKFVWVKYGHVFLRKNNDVNPIRVMGLDFLKTLGKC